MARALIIVESPAKAKTIARFLGDQFSVASGPLEPTVMSSVGHIRDLPQRASDVPESYKGESWARLGVDVDNGFKPLYIVNAGKRDVVRDLKRELKDADELYLATDEDREGEAIAWHLLEVLNPPSSMPVKRMVFHEITPEAIEDAIANPRDLNRRLVDAQETRRLLDRLYGYEVSPVAVAEGRARAVGRPGAERRHPAGRRARARAHAFVAASYWDLEGEFSVERATTDRFTATLVQLDGARLATGKDFDLEGRPTRDGVAVLDEAGATDAGRRAARRAVRRALGRAQAVPPSARRAVHHLDLPAGGRPQAAHVGHRPCDGPVAVRERLHHLHANRHHDAVEHRAHRRPPRDQPSATASSTCPTRPASTPRR